MTPLEKRIQTMFETWLHGYFMTHQGDGDLYHIAKNLVNAHGENPTDLQICTEIEEYYFDHQN